MKRVIALGCLIGVLSFMLTWELVAPEDNVAGTDAVAPAGPSQATRAGADKSSLHGFDAEALADIATSITQRPLFSPTRRPSVDADKSTSPATAPQNLPRLTGVIIGPSGGWAIFVDGNGKSHAAAAGDVVGAFKVQAISPGIVTLSGSEGERVLRPTFVTSPVAASSEIPAPEAPSALAARGNRKRGDAQ